METLFKIAPERFGYMRFISYLYIINRKIAIMKDEILDRMNEQLDNLLGPKPEPVTIDDVTFIDGNVPKVTILNNTERLLRSIDK